LKYRNPTTCAVNCAQRWRSTRSNSLLSFFLDEMPYRRLVTYYFFYYAFMGIFMPYFGLYLQKRGFPSAEIGILLSILQVMRMAAPNMWGWLADRLGCRMPVVRVASVMSLIGFSIMLAFEGFWGIALAISVMSFFWTAQSPLVEALTLAHLHQTPARYGRVRAWGSFGFIVTTMAMGWWLERAPIDSVFQGCMLMLCIIVVCAFAVPEAKPAKAASSGHGFMHILRQRKVASLLGGYMLLTAGHAAFNVFYSIHLVEAGHSKSVVGMLWVIGVVAEILVFIRAPQLFKRFPLRSILLFGCALAVLRFVLMGWCVGSLPILIVVQCMHGITFGACHVSAVSAIHRWFGDAHQGQGQAVFNSLCYGGGGIVGGVVSGWLWDSVGAGWTYTGGSLFAALGWLVIFTGWKETRNAGGAHA
jgi:MFS transporter, PPP family, 3-phenylpropionic acid transporter